MPRADEPRVTVRFSKVQFAVLEEAARVRGLKVGTLVREAAWAWASEVVSSVPAAPERQWDPRTTTATPVETVEQQPPLSGVVSSALAKRAGLTTARDLMLERQKRLNEGKS